MSRRPDLAVMLIGIWMCLIWLDRSVWWVDVEKDSASMYRDDGHGWCF